LISPEHLQWSKPTAVRVLLQTEAATLVRFGRLAGSWIKSAPDARGAPVRGGAVGHAPGDTADPFYDPHVFDGRVGVDARVLLTST